MDRTIYAYNHKLTRMKFTLRDQDNDLSDNVNCGGGGWWYCGCGYITLNARYKYMHILVNLEVLTPTFVEMKIKPQD